MKQLKRMIALLLVAVLCFSMIPLTVLAEEETEPSAMLEYAEAEEATDEAEVSPEDNYIEEVPELPDGEREEAPEQPEDNAEGATEHPERAEEEPAEQEETPEGAPTELEQPQMTDILQQILEGVSSVGYYMVDGVRNIRISNGEVTRTMTEEAFFAYPGTECYREQLFGSMVDEEDLPEDETAILSTALVSAPTVKWLTEEVGYVEMSAPWISITGQYAVAVELYKKGVDQSFVAGSCLYPGDKTWDFREEIENNGSGSYYIKAYAVYCHIDADGSWYEGDVAGKVGYSGTFAYTVPSRKLAKPANIYQDSAGIHWTTSEPARLAIDFATKVGSDYKFFAGQRAISWSATSFFVEEVDLDDWLWAPFFESGRTSSALYYRIRALSPDFTKVRSSEWTEWIKYSDTPLAADTIGTQIPGTENIPVSYSESNTNPETVGIEYIPYSDRFFSENPATYSNKLAMISLGATMSATTVGSSKNNSVKYNGDGLIREFLQNIGVDSGAIRTYKFDDNQSSDDTAAYALGIKQLSDGSYLMPIIIRSSGYGPDFTGEWASNFRVYGGQKGYSMGFKKAADGVYAGVKSYLAELSKVGIEVSQIKFWVTGFSRGGAVANLVAAELNKRGDVSKSNIFAYCFATPAVAEKSKVSAYTNIHNIMSQQDVVPRVPLYEWTYTRNGQQHYLPSISDSSKYRNQRDQMKTQFNAIMSKAGRGVRYQVIEGQEIAIDLLLDYVEDIIATPYSYSASGVQANLVKKMSGGTLDIAGTIIKVVCFSTTDIDKYEQFISYFKNFGNYDLKQKFTEAASLSRSLLGGTKSNALCVVSEMLANYCLRYAASNVTLYPLWISTGIGGGSMPVKVTTGDYTKNYDNLIEMISNLSEGQSSYLFMQHWPEVYLAWLRTNSESGSLFTEGHKITCVKCPVDVKVYDSENNLVCRIVDDVVDESIENGIYAYVELNGEKVLYLPADETYTVLTTAREDGTVSFTTTDYDPEGTRGDTTVFVNESMEEHQLFTMVDDTVTTNGETLTPDLTYTGEVTMTASAQVIGDGMVSGTGEYCLGDTVFLYAMQSGSDEFVAWLDADGNLLSTEGYYSYLALEDTAVTALFAENPGVTLDRSYLAMAVNDTTDLEATVIPEQLSGYLTWSVEAADADETTVITIDESGKVTARTEGTVYALATVDLGAKTYTARCRVDVSTQPVSEIVTGVGLGQNTATVSLFSTNYTELELLLLMERISGIQSNVLPQDTVEGNGHSVTAVRFDPDSPNGAAAAELFNPVMKDDRTLQLIPTNVALLTGETEKLAAKYNVRLIVTVDGVDFTTTNLTISLTQTKPTIKAAAVKLNAFTPGIPAELSFTGGKVTALELAADSALPEGLLLDTAAKTITVSAENPPATYKSGKLNLLATVKGCAIKVPVTVSYSFANKKPSVKFNTKTLTLTPATLDTASASFTITPAEFTDAEKFPVTIASVTEAYGKTIVPCDNIESETEGETRWLTDNGTLRITLDGNTLSVHAEQLETTEAARSFVINLSVNGSFFPLKLKVNPKKTAPAISVKATGAIDTAIPNSPITLKLTAKNYHLGSGEGYQLQLTERIPETGELLEADDLFVRSDSGDTILLTQAPGAELNTKHAYAAVVLADLNRDGVFETICGEVKLTVKASDPAKVAPTVALKVSGAIDVIRTTGAITVKPTIKNCYGYTLQAADLKLYTVNGKEFAPIADEDNPFSVAVNDDAYVITVLNREKINHSVKYAVRYESELNGVQVLSGKAPTKLSVKMGSAKLNQSTKQVNLYREDRYGTGEVIISAAQAELTGIDRIELDAKSAEFYAIRYLGNGKVSIGFKDNAVKPGAKAVTASLTVYLKGNQSTKPNGTVKVKINLLNTK